RCARLLAKPEYSSPPDEVRCWLGRCDGDSGRECHGEEDDGTVAENYREAQNSEKQERNYEKKAQ
ncbi:MAG: hypothetical protein ACI3YW_00420, partial [Candidatus Egerieousia sp.]